MTFSSLFSSNQCVVPSHTCQCTCCSYLASFYFLVWNDQNHIWSSRLESWRRTRSRLSLLEVGRLIKSLRGNSKYKWSFLQWINDKYWSFLCVSIHLKRLTPWPDLHDFVHAVTAPIKACETNTERLLSAQMEWNHSLTPVHPAWNKLRDSQRRNAAAFPAASLII